MPLNASTHRPPEHRPPNLPLHIPFDPYAASIRHSLSIAHNRIAISIMFTVQVVAVVLWMVTRAEVYMWMLAAYAIVCGVWGLVVIGRMWILLLREEEGEEVEIGIGSADRMKGDGLGTSKGRRGEKDGGM